MAAAVSRDPDRALRLHARDELGVDPTDLPSPLLAGGAALIAFSLGALLPLLLAGGMVVGRGDRATFGGSSSSSVEG